MKFKVGDRVKIVNKDSEELDSRIIGATGTVVEIDDWNYPIELEYDDDEFANLSDMGNLQNLFKEEDLEHLEYKESEPKPKKTFALPSHQKIAYIRDVDRRNEFGYEGEHRTISIIDLESGFHRKTMIGFDAEDFIDYIQETKPSQVVFDIHDKYFRNTFIDIANKNNFGFKIKENGVVEYDGE